jgi:O-acetyl-ADP-ribose deacetylase (regulator of RNase III)
MIKLTQGNLLNAPVDAVNTEGVMGKGIALQFKQVYPQMFRTYERACKMDEVRLGKMDVHNLGGLMGGPRWIINFPTKGHWRSNSRMIDIESGLQDLTATITRLGIRSIAVPPLGCGLGGLDWNEVRPMIESALGVLPEVTVLLYQPGGVPEATNLPNRDLI